MSGLIGAIDKTFHKVKGDQEAAEAKHTMTGKVVLFPFPPVNFLLTAVLVLVT